MMIAVPGFFPSIFALLSIVPSSGPSVSTAAAQPSLSVVIVVSGCPAKVGKSLVYFWVRVC